MSLAAQILAPVARTVADATFFNLGPLTTLFIPEVTCPGRCWVLGDPDITSPSTKVRSICTEYDADCGGYGSCMPTVQGTNGLVTWSYGGYYSPGLSCPHKWTTAVTLSSGMTESVYGVDNIISRLGSLETAALCCPSSFTIQLDRPDGSWDWEPSITPPCCISSKTEGYFLFFSCYYEKLQYTFQLFTLGSTTLRSYATLTTQTEYTDDSGNVRTTTETVTTTTDVGTVLMETAFSIAPAVQLIWRPEDLTQSSLVTVTTTEGPLTTIISPNKTVGATIEPEATAAPGAESTAGLISPDWNLAVSRPAFIGIVTAAAVVFTALVVLLVWVVCRKIRNESGGGATSTPPTAPDGVSGGPKKLQSRPRQSLPSDGVSPLTPTIRSQPDFITRAADTSDGEVYELHPGMLPELSATRRGTPVRYW